MILDKDILWGKIVDKFTNEVGPLTVNNSIKPIKTADLKQLPNENSDESIVWQLILEMPNELIESEWKEKYEMSFIRHAYDISGYLIQPSTRVVTMINNPVNNPTSTINPIENPNDFAKSSDLNPNYTFERFVVGDTNRFADASARLVSERPGIEYNPLFIYGGVGLGKTHLMQAIGNELYKNQPNAVIKVVTADDFSNDYTEATRKNTFDQLRNNYRNVDLLLIDDVQFLSDKKKIQEEFFNVFNALYKAGHQIVMTSDRLPQDMQGMEDRLVSRFSQGLSIPIQKPDLPMRIAILRNLAESENLNISDSVIDLIAEKIDSNVRDLEGAYNQIAMRTKYSQNVTYEQTEDILKALNININKEINIDNIQKIVSDFYNITVNEMKSTKRNKEIVQPRQIAMYLARKLTDNSLPKIGKAFGNRDHTTVMHATDKISEKVDNDLNVHETIDVLIDKIKTS